MVSLFFISWGICIESFKRKWGCIKIGTVPNILSFFKEKLYNKKR